MGPRSEDLRLPTSVWMLMLQTRAHACYGHPQFWMNCLRRVTETPSLGSCSPNQLRHIFFCSHAVGSCLPAAFRECFIRQLTCTNISYSYQLILSHANLTWALRAKANPYIGQSRSMHHPMPLRGRASKRSCCEAPIQIRNQPKPWSSFRPGRKQA